MLASTLARTTKPVTPTERLEWARLDLEDAAQRLADDPHRSPAYVAAVIGRARELAALRLCAKQEAER